MCKPFAFIMVFLLVSLTGCSEKATSPTGEAQQQLSSAMPGEVGQLLQKYAGLDENAPGAVPEAKAPNPPVSPNEYDIYAVTFLWGHLANFPGQASLTTDWSGTLRINAEALIDVRFTIDFEPGQDSLIPSSNPASAAWVSYTQSDFDGLSFRVAVKRGNAYFAAPELTFETASITIRIPVHQLEHYVAYYPVGNTEGVAVLARRIPPGGCPSGAMRGTWVKENNTGDRGRFDGLWLDDDGNITGVYAGTFWTNNDGTREFSGWVSGYFTDQIIAEMKGSWYYDDPRMCPLCGAGHGRFFGKVRFLTNTDVGVVFGEFGDFSSPVDQLALPMVGVWKIICPWVNGPANVTGAR